MKKLDKIEALISDYEFIVKKQPDSVLKNESLFAIIMVLNTLAKDTEYEERITYLVTEAEKHIYD